jgi:hypothetical protein
MVVKSDTKYFKWWYDAEWIPVDMQGDKLITISLHFLTFKRMFALPIVVFHLGQIVMSVGHV